MGCIFLLGFMGSGKSTYGAEAAAMLGLPFLDLDTEIERSAGMGIYDIFREKGEAAFREMERDTLRALASRDSSVIATGGGTPCFHGNMDFMNASGLTIYLKADAEILCGRLKGYCQDRPLLAAADGDGLTGEIRRMLSEREPFYSRATFTVPSADGISARSIRDIVNRHRTEL